MMEEANGPYEGPIIDMWAPIIPTRDVIDDIAINFPPQQLQYLEIFTKQSISEGEFAAYANTLVRPDEDIMAELDRAEIRHSLITGFDEGSTTGKTFVSNETIAAVVERHPGRFIPFAGADIMHGSKAVDELEYWITERGFRGLSLRPFMIGKSPTHEAYRPFYEKCVELGVPLSIHTSANWTRTQPSDLGHPSYIDKVACEFPDLQVIMSHAGYPWVLEACLTAWKHPNVYIELAAHRPRYFTAPGAGWEPLMRFGQRTIADKVIFGTGAFLINRPYAELAQEMRQLPLSHEIAEKWLWSNAASLMGFSLMRGKQT